MAYGVANHGAWCGAKTYPTRCRYCGNQVFYFSCGCGSKVFFSELGGTWPEHRCLNLLAETYGKDFIQGAMALQMKKHVASKIHTRIEKGYESAVRKQFEARKSKGTTWIRGIAPLGAQTVEDSAVVKEVLPGVDLFQKLGLPSGSPMAAAFVRTLGSDSFGQVTFHIGALDANSVESYTAIVRGRDMARLRPERGDLVLVTLKSMNLGTKGWRWVCERLEFVT